MKTFLNETLVDKSVYLERQHGLTFYSSRFKDELFQIFDDLITLYCYLALLEPTHHPDELVYANYYPSFYLY